PKAVDRTMPPRYRPAVAAWPPRARLYQSGSSKVRRLDHIVRTLEYQIVPAKLLGDQVEQLSPHFPGRGRTLQGRLEQQSGFLRQAPAMRTSVLQKLPLQMRINIADEQIGHVHLV